MLKKSNCQSRVHIKIPNTCVIVSFKNAIKFANILNIFNRNFRNQSLANLHRLTLNFQSSKCNIYLCRKITNSARSIYITTDLGYENGSSICEYYGDSCRAAFNFYEIAANCVIIDAASVIIKITTLIKICCCRISLFCKFISLSRIKACWE